MDNLSKFQVVFMDQYFACDFDLLLSKLLVRLEPQQSGGDFFRSKTRTYINLAGLIMKMVVSLTLLIFKPDWSGLYNSYQYFAYFAKFGGF